MKPGADLRKRAAAARAEAAAARKWTALVTSAAAGTMWRVSAAWVEQRDGSRCVDLTHISTGRTRSMRFTATDTAEFCRAQILGQ